MKYFLLAFTFCFLSVFVSAQEENTLVPDVIVFTNGSSIQGKIVQITKKYVSIKRGSAPFSFHKSKISSIVYDGIRIPMSSKIQPVSVPKEKKRSDAEYEYIVKLKKEPLKSGFYNITFGHLIFRGADQFDGFSSSSSGGVGIANISGFQFSQYVGIGLGLGYMASDYGNNSVPLFTEFRGYLSAKKQSAYYNVAVGLNFGYKGKSYRYSSSEPGTYLHPSIGYKFGSDVSAFMIDLGLQFSNVTYINDTETFYSKELHSSQRVVLRIGVML